MAQAFENPANGYRETVDANASIAVFFLGVLYLAVRGLWGHVFIWLLLVGIPTFASGGPLLLIALPLASGIYALTIQSILANRYLEKGWRAYDPSRAMEAQKAEQQIWYRKCPYCAEEVLAEAIKCKHCQSDLIPVTPEA